ncbi:MAG: hypothetical protein U9N59_15330 [Campylobacterota bacterium]|nr:hypothetical protein [Campylobacterota bacterium]
MKDFFVLEAGLITVSVFLLAVTAFTTTRSFVPQGYFKKSFSGVFIVLAIVIALHYTQTVDRMKLVKNEFEKGKIIVCDNKGDLRLGRNVLIDKSRYGWHTDGFFFISKEYPRKFHISRCVVHLAQK